MIEILHFQITQIATGIGFYGWTGGHNTYQWCSTNGRIVLTY